MDTDQKITLYSTGCPNCKSLESILDRKGIVYTIINSEEEIIKLGFSSAPLLKVGEEVMTFYQAVKWLNTIQPGDSNK